MDKINSVARKCLQFLNYDLWNSYRVLTKHENMLGDFYSKIAD